MALSAETDESSIQCSVRPHPYHFQCYLPDGRMILFWPLVRNFFICFPSRIQIFTTDPVKTSLAQEAAHTLLRLVAFNAYDVNFGVDPYILSQVLHWEEAFHPASGKYKCACPSSIAIASSIGSPTIHTSHPPTSGEQETHTSHSDRQAIGQEPNPHPAIELAWTTAYSTTKMVIEITKESSDMFLPLKTVVGALFVLIKNYDVSLSQ